MTKNDCNCMDVNFSDLIGAPYRVGARGEDGFYDCYGICIEAARRLGRRLDDIGATENDIALADEYAPSLNVERTDAPETGALLEMDGGGGILHIGICLDGRTFIHATTTQGVRVSRIGCLPVLGVYRIKD